MGRVKVRLRLAHSDPAWEHRRRTSTLPVGLTAMPPCQSRHLSGYLRPASGYARLACGPSAAAAAGRDLRALFALLRPRADGRAPRHTALLLRLLAAVARHEGPPAFFDFSGGGGGIMRSGDLRLPGAPPEPNRKCFGRVKLRGKHAGVAHHERPCSTPASVPGVQVSSALQRQHGAAGALPLCPTTSMQGHSAGYGVFLAALTAAWHPFTRVCGRALTLSLLVRADCGQCGNGGNDARRQPRARPARRQQGVLLRDLAAHGDRRARADARRARALHAAVPLGRRRARRRGLRPRHGP